MPAAFSAIILAAILAPILAMLIGVAVIGAMYALAALVNAF